MGKWKLTAFLLLLLGMTNLANASWVDIPVVNPGAELDMQGWTGNFLSISDADAAYEDSKYFSANLSENIFVYSMEQHIDLSAYSGTITDLELSAMVKFDRQTIIGKNTDGTEFGYQFSTFVLISCFNAEDQSVGSLIGMPPSDTNDEDWQRIATSFAYELIVADIDHVVISLNFFPLSSDPEAPLLPDNWEEWVDGVSTSADFDAVEFKINTVPIPAGIWLLCSGIIGMIGFRKKMRR